MSFLREPSDLPRDELRIIPHPSDQCRTARVLPCETKEVEAWDLGNAASVADRAVLLEDRQVDPGVIRAVSGRPYNGVNEERFPGGYKKERAPIAGTLSRRQQENAAAIRSEQAAASGLP